MDLGPTATASVAAPAAPRHVPDLRPAADAAATRHSRTPPLPVGPGATLPPAATQSGEVSRSLMLANGLEESDAVRMMQPVTAVPRTLKPFGISMLPDSLRGAAARDGARDASAPEPGPEDRSAVVTTTGPD